MRHTQARRMLAARRYLTPTEHYRLDEHLVRCDECRALMEEFAHQDAFLATLSRATPPASVRRGVQNGQPTQVRQSRWHLLAAVSLARSLPALLLTIAAIALAVVAVALHRSSVVTKPTGGSPTGQARPTEQALPPYPLRMTTVSRDTRNGLKIELSAPVAVPMNALMRVTARWTNTSKRDIRIGHSGLSIGVEVFGDRVAGDPAAGGELAPYIPLSGPQYRLKPVLQPGQAMELEFYGVASERHLRAYATREKIRGHVAHVIFIAGPTITLHLTPQRPPPALVLRTHPDVEVAVRSSVTHPGPLIYNAMTGCVASKGSWATTGSLGQSSWSPSTGSVLKAVWPPQTFNFTCGHSLEWHVQAGYIGQSPAVLDYILPSPRIPPGSVVPARVTTCAADRARQLPLPLVARHVIHETDVVQVTCATVPSSMGVRVATMSLQEFLDLRHVKNKGSSGDQWVWVVSLYTSARSRHVPPTAILTKVFDGISGTELPNYSCTHCNPLAGK